MSEGLVGTYCAFFFPVLKCRDVFLFVFCLHFHCYFVSLDLYSLSFCIKMKSETQNIYNFCMEKKKEECKTHTHTKSEKLWKLFFIVLAEKRRQEKKKRNVTKILSFLHL